MIKLKFSAVDGWSKTSTYKTMAGAQKAAHHRVGRNPEMAPGYAVSSDGIVKVSVEGASLKELFPESAKPAGEDFYVVAGKWLGTWEAAKAEKEALINDGCGVFPIEKYNTADVYGG